METKDKHL
jgi:hypothetical protein